MNILAIDPGCTESAWMVYDTTLGKPLSFYFEGNTELKDRIATEDDGGSDFSFGFRVHDFVIEGIASYGMPVGRETFDTCIWIGRFIERWGNTEGTTILYRKDIKLHLCGTSRAKDANIRQVLIDRFGGKEAAIGRKASPGPLYGISKHHWSTLAIAVTYADTKLIVPVPITREASASVALDHDPKCVTPCDPTASLVSMLESTGAKVVDVSAIDADRKGRRMGRKVAR